jgi:outer membrane protein assembly factor BamB
MSIVRWEGHPLFARSPTNSLAIDDLVVVCLGRDWFCLDSRTGRVVWAVTVAALGTRGSNVYDLASDGESVYTRADDVCACLDAQTGEVRWTIPKGRFSYTQSSGRRMRMAVSPSYLYFSGGDIVNGKKLLFVINKRDGEVVWQGQLRTYYDAPMVTPINGHLYAAHYDNLEDDWSLQCFESR